MTLATEMDSIREFARNVGVDHSDQAWILSPQDVWERNPFYTGPASGAVHPEEADYYAQLQYYLEFENYGPPAPVVCEAAVLVGWDDDIPF